LSLTATLDGTRAELARLDGATDEHNTLAREIAQVQENADAAAKKREEARMSESFDDHRFTNIGLMEAPTASAIPLSSNRQLYLLSGCILAFILSTGLAFACNATRTTFETAEELQEYTRVAVVTDVPLMSGATPSGLNGRELRGAQTW
ncbi:MAG TPA: hypothetical protein VES20_21990, partial [Bryobacteraceae bacterium]|nr:hypothetical protein [Bryobacteraceae bacterium]